MQDDCRLVGPEHVIDQGKPAAVGARFNACLSGHILYVWFLRRPRDSDWLFGKYYVYT